jgi:hypothetical protein
LILPPADNTQHKVHINQCNFGTSITTIPHAHSQQHWLD